jgi:hypothetical protein
MPQLHENLQSWSTYQRVGVDPLVAARRPDIFEMIVDLVQDQQKSLDKVSTDLLQLHPFCVSQHLMAVDAVIQNYRRQKEASRHLEQ